MKYRNYTLDSFQEDSINYLKQNYSVVVSAPTGTGKTLIADFLISKALSEEKKIIYTSPIKALSNQKYNEFKELYGKKIGLLTGDVSINPTADVLIMTTEIYRNMLLSRDPITRKISYVVFDEVHFINDYERGTVWEESIIFSPEHMRFLCLSATIPNAQEFADWISSIKKHDVKVIFHDIRPVPLTNYFFHRGNGMMEVNKSSVKNLNYIEAKKKDSVYISRSGRRGKRPRDDNYGTDIDLVEELCYKKEYPILHFSFSRKDTEAFADLLVKKGSVFKNIVSSEEKAKIVKISREFLEGEINRLRSTTLLRKVLSYGIAFHHAGLLPKQKELVEKLFSEGLLKIVCATETFALGINMPAKTVVFHSLRKWDGRSFRFVTSKEYFQMAGRAGRRGIDTSGNAVVPLSDVNRDVQDLVFEMIQQGAEPIESQYKITYNTAINLMNSFSKDDRYEILRNNFYYYTHKKSGNIITTFESYVKKLKKMGYIENDKVTKKGLFLSRIYSNEIVVSELMFSDIIDTFDPTEINVVLGAIIYEHRPNTRFFIRDKFYYKRAAELLSRLNHEKYLMKEINRLDLKHLLPIIFEWSTNEDFEQLLRLSTLKEGDYIRFFRQLLDVEEQIISAFMFLNKYEPEIRQKRNDKIIRKIEKAKEMINKSFVKFE